MNQFIHKLCLINLLPLFIFLNLQAQNTQERLIEAERVKTLKHATFYLDAEPITVTAARANRSSGGLHDYFSEGTYWWPDPEEPNGPYIRKDGLVNPDNFDDHLEALQRFSMISGTLTAAYLLTGEKVYAEQAIKHLKAWFVNPATRMNPHFLYAQAIHGRVSGRGIGIIDGIHLIDPAQSVKVLANSPYLSTEDLTIIKSWFNDLINWLKTHPYGIEEMNWRNNHGTWWHTQVAAFASLTGDLKTLEFCKNRMIEVLIPNQMAHDGSFPLELERTRPYAYSFFNTDGMIALAFFLSQELDDMWEFQLEDGRGVKKAVDFMHHYTKRKELWPLNADVDFWDELPNRRPFLVLAALGYQNSAYMDTWLAIPDKELSNEGWRNLGLKNLLLWVDLPHK